MPRNTGKAIRYRYSSLAISGVEYVTSRTHQCYVLSCLKIPSALNSTHKALRIVTVPLPSLSAPGAAIIDSKNRSNEKTGDIEIRNQRDQACYYTCAAYQGKSEFQGILLLLL
jgi:hypothetical protein